MAEPPEKGDWIITSLQSIEGRTVTLNGNLVVKGNGSLTLKDATLLVNSGFDGQYKISVEPGGSMYVYGSTITAVNPEHRFAFVVSGSAFEMKDSELHGVGWQSGTGVKSKDVNQLIEAKGLVLETPGAILEGSIISDNFIGMMVLADRATIRGNTFRSNDYQALSISSSWNTITGNSFDHATTFDSNIMTMSSSNNNIITGNTFTQKPLLRWQNMGGISASNSWNNIITDNTMDVDWPIGMFNGSNNIIRNNTFTVREVAVWIRAGVRNRIEGNQIQLVDRGQSAVRYGILLIYSHENVVAGNNLWGSSQGGYGTLFLDHSDRNYVLNNQLSVPAQRSIFLLASRDNVLSGNQVSTGGTDNAGKGGGVGLFLYYQADGNKIFDNSVTQSLNSVIVDGSSGNFIYDNNFTGQKQQYDNGVNSWDYQGRGNYWNDYQVKDSDGDGIGDAPYSLAPNGVDRYPLARPATITPSAIPEVKPVSLTDGPQSWTVNNMNVAGEKVIANQTLVMEAGVIGVQPTGSLVIRDSTLILGGKGPIDITVAGGGSITIERSVIKAAVNGNRLQIIDADGSTLVMKDSELHGASWNIGGGMFVERAKSAVIENNLIAGSQAGMYLGHVGSARIVNNTIRGTGQGIFVDTTSHVLVEGNTVDGAVWSGIGVMGWEEVSNIEVTHNSVLRSWGVGISVSGNTLVDGNTVSDCGAGISVLGDNNIVRGNSVSGSGWGLTVSGNNNTAYHNNLISTRGGDWGKNNRWDNGSQGNYWSDYKGKDESLDGIGDTPYSVPPNGYDAYPLMKPFER